MKGKLQLTSKPQHPETRIEQAPTLVPLVKYEPSSDERIVALVQLLARRAAEEDYNELLRHSRFKPELKDRP